MHLKAIDAWTRSGADGSAQRAQQIHDAMIQTFHETENPLIAPSTVSYNSVMNAWSKCNDPNAARNADNLLMELIESYRNGNNDVKPDAIGFSTVLHAYAKSGLRERVARSEELFEMMDSLDITPSSFTYSALQNVYARAGTDDAPQKTQKVLDRMIELYKAGNMNMKPNAINYNDVLNALSRTPSRKSAEMADRLLAMMELPVDQNGYDVEPDRLSYAVAILACARCPDEAFAAQAAEANLRKLEARARRENQRRREISSAAPPSVTLDIESFNVVLTAISKSRQPDAPERVLDIIRRMEQYAADGSEALRPNLRSWNAVLNSFARATKRKDKNFADEAENVLKRMLIQSGKGQTSLKPNAFTFAAVLNAQQRSGDPAAAERADSIVRQMEELYELGDLDAPPDVFHYTILLSTWARSESPHAADRCLQILAHMYDRSQAGFKSIKPNVRTYNAVLDCLSKSRQEDNSEQLLYHMLDRYRKGDHAAKPDAFSFNCVIRAFVKSDARGSGKRAEAVLDRFLEFQEENPAVRPDTRSFGHIVSHYSRSSAMDAPYRAEYVLNRMIALYKSGHKHLEPSLSIITTVMDSYSYANHPDAGSNAERLLRLIRELEISCGCFHMVANTAVMNSVLMAYATSAAKNEQASFRAEELLNEMERGYAAGVASLRPDTKSYGLVMSAWSKSCSAHKARRALQLLRHMEKIQREGNDQAQVGEHAYSLVINTCAFCNDAVDVEMDAFEIAVQIFDEMLSSSDKSPSSLTYGWYIQACGRLRVSHEKRAKEIEKAFKRCCDDGLLNDFVLHRLKGAASDDVFLSLFSRTALSNLKDARKHKVFIDQLPSKWRRNCK